MSGSEPPKITDIGPDILAARCHDVTTCLHGRQVGDFDQLSITGMAVRLALHLRGVQAVEYALLKQIGLHLLQIPPTSLPTVMDLLETAEFVRLDKAGRTIRNVVPTVPFYEDLFTQLGTIAKDRGLSEPEELTITMVERLAQGPLSASTIYNWGADRKLLDRMLDVARTGGYLIQRRARGRDVLVSPMYFPEHSDAFADVVAAHGSNPVARVLSVVSANQGWPLSLTAQIGDTTLSPQEIAIVQRLASDGVSPAPAIETTHHGKNHFVFGPRPGLPRLLPTKRHIYETAMALVAAVRQGQLLPAQYAIRSPTLLLQALRDRKRVRASTEAFEQYRALTVLRLGRLVPQGSSWHEFRLIDLPDNVEAVELALTLVQGEGPKPAIDDEIILAFRKGQEYVDSLVSRQQLVPHETLPIDPESQREIDNLLLRGAS